MLQQGKAPWVGSEEVKLQPLPAPAQPCQEPDRQSMINAEVKPFHQLQPESALQQHCSPHQGTPGVFTDHPECRGCAAPPCSTELTPLITVSAVTSLFLSPARAA